MKRSIAGLAAGASAVFLVATASGQSPGAGDDGVVVTADRFSQLKQNLPGGVTVISAEDIRKSATSNLAEILAQFGQLHIRDLSGAADQQIDLRGFGVTGDQNTLILIDGVKLSENELVAAQLTSVPLESIDRIEILRGGGGVLYGGGAVGGTINIITRRGRSGETRAYAIARAGGYGTQDYRLGYSRQEGALGASFDYADEDTAGYRRNNRYQQTNLNGTFEARTDSVRAYLRFGADQQALRLPGGLTETQMNADRRQTFQPNNYSARNGGRVSLGGSVTAGRNEFSADLGYRQKHAIADFANFAFYTDTKANTWTFSPRAKFVFDAFGRTHDVVVGADTERWDYQTASASSPVTIGNPASLFSNRFGKQDTDALYGQANFQLAERTRLTLGSRAQRTEDRVRETVFPIDDRRVSRSLHANEIGLRQQLGGGWSAYGKFGSSFRLANIDENACFGAPCPPLLQPQTAKGGEGGLELALGGLNVRASYYDLRLRNEIYFSPLTFTNLNLSPTERKGLELAGSWRATPSLDLRASFALIQARFRSGVYGGTDVSGKDVPQVPESLATFGASWSISEAGRLNANLRYVGKERYDNDQANTFSRLQPAYGLADFKYEYRFGKVSLAAEVKNLFDKKYYSYGIWDQVSSTSSFTALPAPGRAAYLSLAYRL